MEDNIYIQKFLEVVSRFPKEEKCSHSNIAIVQGERAILRILGENPKGLNPSDLADKVQVGSGRIGNVLKVLEGKGLVIRETDEKDHRKTVVTLTEPGKRRSDLIKERFITTIDYVVGCMGEVDYFRFLDLLDAFMTAFTKKAEEVKDDKIDALS